MSIIISGLSYALPGGEPLLDSISFTVLPREKVSLTGDNGTGKSTLLRLIAGEIHPGSGSIAVDGTLWYVPQHYGHYDRLRVCDALGAGGKVDALAAITAGSTSGDDFAAVGDDWDIDERILASLDAWGLGGIEPATAMERLSGGEKTRVFLAGITLSAPQVILLDEPTNHLDTACRQKLYDFIERSTASILTVSHDRTLLDMFGTTMELSRGGVRRYGGNYCFYREQKNIEANALENSISEGEKSLRAARRIARETMERKQKSDAQGKRKKLSEGVPRIMMNTLRDGAEKSAAGLADKHAAKIGDAQSQVRELRAQRAPANIMKVKMEGSALHGGKILVRAEGINFGYGSGGSRPGLVEEGPAGTGTKGETLPEKGTERGEVLGVSPEAGETLGMGSEPGEVLKIGPEAGEALRPEDGQVLAIGSEPGKLSGTDPETVPGTENLLWNTPLDLLILSGDRIRISGPNGCGKTTLINIITGRLDPSAGVIERAVFSHTYIDQEYSLIDNSLTVIGQLEKYNVRNRPGHMLRTELDRYLFPAATWDKPCGALSGGEKMRLALCCILTLDNAPDMLVLDEPTNNLDIRSMAILANAVRGYRGTVLLISHDEAFAGDVGVNRTIDLS